MSSPKTLSPGTPNVTLTGLLNAYGPVGTYDIRNNGSLTPQTIYAAVVGHAGTHFTIHNTGTIHSLGTTEFDGGIVLGASGTILNTGSIIAGTGIAIFGTTGKSTLSNTGKIIGSLGIGVFTSDFTDVTNSKFIYGNNYGLELGAGGIVENLAKGTIATNAGVAIASKLAATITNAGTLQGEYGGIFLQSGGTVDNTGLILQTNANSNAGAIESYQAASLTNAGTIYGGNGIKIDVSTPTAAAYINNTGTVSANSAADINGNYATGFLRYGVGIYTNTYGEVVNSNAITGNHVGIVFEHAVGTVLNTGSISASVGYGVYLNVGGTVSNTGTIYGYDQGMFAGAGSVTNYITNSGFIGAARPPFYVAPYGTFFGGGIVNDGGGTVINTGTVSDPGGGAIQQFGFTGTLSSVINAGLVQGLYGVQFAGAGGVQNTGIITGQDDGVFAETAGEQVYNSGLIEAYGATFNYSTVTSNTYTAAGVRLKSGGTITNAASGQIIAFGGDAVHAYNAPAYIYNTGVINGAKVGVFLSAGGFVQNAGYIAGGTSGIYNEGSSNLSVYNATTGFITAAHNGIDDANGGPGDLTNNGTILATDTTFTDKNGTLAFSHGVLFKYGGSVINNSYGTIEGAVGISIDGSVASYVYNAGQVVSTTRAGIYLQAGGTVINAASGLVHSARPGIELYGAGYALNAGLIDSGRSGIYLKSGGGAVNTGDISAATTGIYVLSGPATVTNAGTITGAYGVILASGGTVTDTGTISGSSYAISFATGPADLLVIDAGADIIGAVNGGNGTLEFAADGADIGTFDTTMLAQFNDFDTIIIGPGAIWNTGNDATIADPTGLTNDGTLIISATEKLTIENALTGTGTVELSKKALTLNGSVASGQKISFTGTGETLDLGDAKKFSGKIEKFALGDTIDLTSISLSAITATHFVNGVLTLSEGSTKLEFTFANPASFGSDKFKLKADGHGTVITLAAAAAALLPVTHVTTLTPLTTLGS